MQIIAHRINTLKDLRQVPEQLGVEIDLRDHGDRLILQHDPFRDGEDLERYLQEYRHRTIILNIKSERIEFRVLDLLEKYNIDDYFFLDSSFPMMYLLAKQGIKNIAVRFSEFEGIDTVLNMAGTLEWVWVDCFTRFPLSFQDYSLLKSKNFKLCLVSPELQGRADEIESYRAHLEKSGIVFDAICTKLPYVNKWT